MNMKTLHDIIYAKVEKIWTHAWRERDITVEFAKINGEGVVDITVTSMYDAPGLTFNQLNELSQFFFGTTRIDTISDIEQEGCDTCDYGSCYGFTIRVFPPKKEQKPISESTHGYMVTP